MITQKSSKTTAAVSARPFFNSINPRLFALPMLVTALSAAMACGSSEGEEDPEPGADDGVGNADDGADQSDVPFESDRVIEVDADGGVGKADDGADQSDVLFESDRVLEVDIEMDPADWDLIRYEGRSLPKTLSGCFEELEYTYVEATVTVDGEAFENVAVRKKGFLGSISVVRPSLKVNFGRIVRGQTVRGMKRMTLNNDRQDASHTHQCMTYWLFRRVGSIAPRCNFAHVTVNGKDLGIYTHIDSIKRPFLRRNFGDDSGNLYEGQIADFSENMIGKFEFKTNLQSNDGSDLVEVVEALKADGDKLYDSLDKVVDMEAFYTHWVLEVITGHWDGYAGDQNNFYTYHDPVSDKFFFIPWGTDGAFGDKHEFLPNDIPKSVYAWSWIPYRLYSFPATRAIYHEKLRRFLDDYWNEEELLSQVDQIGELTQADEASLDKQRDYIRKRKKNILDELVDSGPDWHYEPRSIPMVCFPATEIGGTFDATWGDIDNYAPSTVSSFKQPLENKPQEFAMYLTSAGLEKVGNSGIPIGTPEIYIIGVPAQEPGGESPRSILVVLAVEPSLFGQKEVFFHGFETFGALVQSTGDRDTSVILGFIGDGKIIFDEVGSQPGDRIKGSFSGLFAPMMTTELDVGGE